jgi:hypothetical protein
MGKNILETLGGEVDFIMDEIKQTLSKVGGGEIDINDNSIVDDDSTEMKLNQGFSKILSDIQSSDKLTTTQKRFLFAEATLAIEDVKDSNDINNFKNSLSASLDKTRRLECQKIKTTLYSPLYAPYVIVYGPGPVGQALYTLTQKFGNRADFKFLKADQLSIIPDSELLYILRDAKSIIIAADTDLSNNNNNGNSWFTLTSSNSKNTVVNEGSIKRLLNTVNLIRRKSSDSYSVKIIALDVATKQKKSIAASILGDDTFDLENNIIMQCRARNLKYAIVKVGKIIDDEVIFPRNERLNPRKNEIMMSENFEKVVLPFIFTRSRVEANEVTKKSIAVDALLRSASHPQSNSTISVISIDPIKRAPLDEEWDDEFLRIEGPELLRTTFYYTSILQMSIKLGRIAKEIQNPSSGLITPIEVERYSNGVRIIFKPLDNSYKSSKEEKDEENQLNIIEDNNKTSKKPSAYTRPELDIEFNPTLKMSTTTTNIETAVQKNNRKRKVKLEGGLEIILDEIPYKRVRIRRCNMGTDTVVKEESEKIILNAIIFGINQLEAFYFKMMNDESITFK